MSNHSRDRRPYIPPVTRIHLSDSNIRTRLILLAVLAAVAVVSITMGIHYALNKEPGWYEVTSISGQRHCGDDFIFMYECGSSEVSSNTEFKSITALYTRLTEEAFAIFTSEVASEKNNLYYLNTHPNQQVQVDPTLYKALELISRYECRYPFLAPVTAEYYGVFLAENDIEAELHDPMKDEQRMEWVQEKLFFAADPDAVWVELLGDNTVCLHVSDEYLTFAQKNEIETYVDLGWMKNAFIADYLGEQLKQNGYTRGYLASYDGYTRNLDTSGESYFFNIFDRLENTVSMPAQLVYSGGMSIVFLRNYPLSEEDRWHFYAYEDGTVTSVYLSDKTGVGTSSTDNLVSYSAELSCAEILMHTAPVFLEEAFHPDTLLALREKGISSVWAKGSVLHYTEKEAQLSLLPESGGEGYQLAFTE